MRERPKPPPNEDDHGNKHKRGDQKACRDSVDALVVIGHDSSCYANPDRSEERSDGSEKHKDQAGQCLQKKDTQGQNDYRRKDDANEGENAEH